MLALETLQKPRFPLYKVELLHEPIQVIPAASQKQTLRDQSRGSRLLSSELTNNFSVETVEIFHEVHDLSKQFEIICQTVTDFDQLDDLEYRCVAAQYHLLSYDFQSLASMEPLDRGWDSIIEGLCRITTLIFFGTSPRWEHR